MMNMTKNPMFMNEFVIVPPISLTVWKNEKFSYQKNISSNQIKLTYISKIVTFT